MTSRSYNLDLTDVIAFPTSSTSPSFPPEQDEEWIIIREVIQAINYPIRPVYETVDVHGRAGQMKIAFYCDEIQKGRGIKEGHLICLKNAMIHHFVDGSVGYRVEDYDTVTVLKTNLIGLSRINDELKARSNAGKLRECFAKGCSKPAAQRCSSCILTRYCSAECQANDWKEKHRTECEVVKNLVKWLKADMS